MIEIAVEGLAGLAVAAGMTVVVGVAMREPGVNLDGVWPGLLLVCGAIEARGLPRPLM